MTLVELLITVIRLVDFADKAPSFVTFVHFRDFLPRITSFMNVTLALIILSARLLILLPTILALIVNRWIIPLRRA